VPESVRQRLDADRYWTGTGITFTAALMAGFADLVKKTTVVARVAV
jgi:hypothetical protein